MIDLIIVRHGPVSLLISVFLDRIISNINIAVTYLVVVHVAAFPRKRLCFCALISTVTTTTFERHARIEARQFFILIKIHYSQVLLLLLFITKQVHPVTLSLFDSTTVKLFRPKVINKSTKNQRQGTKLYLIESLCAWLHFHFMFYKKNVY